MATKHLGILNALAATIRAAVAAGVPVTVGKSRPISAEDAQAVNLMPDASQALAGMVLGRTTWTTIVEVECYARATGSTTPLEAVDPLLQTVFNAVVADNTLGGLALDTTPTEGETLRWEYADEAETLCKVTARFGVIHQSQDRSIST